MRYLVWLIRLLVFVAVLMFALKNTHTVTVHFLADASAPEVPLVVVMLGWVFFRADTLADAGAYMKTLFSLNFSEVSLTFHAFGSIVLAVAVAMCLLPDRWLPQPTSHAPQQFKAAAFALQGVLVLASIALLLTNARNPFIYFNF